MYTSCVASHDADGGGGSGGAAAPAPGPVAGVPAAGSVGDGTTPPVVFSRTSSCSSGCGLVPPAGEAPAPALATLPRRDRLATELVRLAARTRDVEVLVLRLGVRNGPLDCGRG